MNFTYETERLYLKILNDSYAPKVLDFLKKNRMVFEPYEANKTDNYYTEKYQRATLKLEFNAFIKNNYARFYIFKKDLPDIIIGTISFSNMLKYPFSSASIGYKIDSEYQCLGYATEAIACASHAMFHDNNLHRIEASVLPDNISSLKVLEKVGFEREGLARKSICICGEYKDHIRYSLINNF